MQYYKSHSCYSIDFIRDGGVLKGKWKGERGTRRKDVFCIYDLKTCAYD